MIESLARRRQAELDNKLAGLASELDHWEAQAAAGGPLEKHHTQVHAVIQTLQVPTERVRVLLGDLDGAGTLARAAGIERMVIDLHRMWDDFRGKLALRYVDHFADYLTGADELAYGCYRPAELQGAPREPPLVFFGDALSPVTWVRGRDLPVALIGVPWFQLEHLPDAPIIAHEVGHDVEADLGLGPVLDAAVAGALEEPGHRRAWAAWREEAFADVYGTLALGPAFTRTLIDFLAGEPRAIVLESQREPDWRAHPPSTLRVLLSAATLELMAGGAYAAEAAALRDGWHSAYPSRAMAPFEPDAAAVAAALVQGPYDRWAGPLTDLITFEPDAHLRAVRDARDVAKGLKPRGTDGRQLVAAARLAFDAAPDAFRRRDVSHRLLRRIRESQSVGVRSGTRSPIGAALRDRRAREAGHELTRRLEDRHVQAHDA